jgi:predicted NUDIX family phosphoesterase
MAPGSILVIPRTTVVDNLVHPGYRPDPEIAQRLCDELRTTYRVVPRHEAEDDPRYLQPIPLTYIEFGSRHLLAFPGDDRQSDDRLYGMYALWAGGHIEESDCADDPVRACLARELEEELSTMGLPEPELMGLVRDARSDRSARHVGLVHRIRIDDDAVIQALEGPPNQCQRGSEITQLVDCDALPFPIGRLEPWSEFILRETHPRAPDLAATDVPVRGGATRRSPRGDRRRAP